MEEDIKNPLLRKLEKEKQTEPSWERKLLDSVRKQMKNLILWLGLLDTADLEELKKAADEELCKRKLLEK